MRYYIRSYNVAIQDIPMMYYIRVIVGGNGYCAAYLSRGMAKYSISPGFDGWEPVIVSIEELGGIPPRWLCGFIGGD